MTVPSEVNRSGPYNGNGVTTVFGYGFRIVDETHLNVILKAVDGTETTLSFGTQYSVSGVGDPTGSVTLTVAPATGETVTILRDVPFTQETDLENQGAYYAETVEEGLDLAAMRDQQLQEQLDRAVLIPPSSDNDGGELSRQLAEDITRLADSADNIDTVADSIDAVVTVSDDIASVVSVAENIDAVVAFSGSVLSLVDQSYIAAAAQTVFTLPTAAIAPENVIVWAGGVRQVPEDDYVVSGDVMTFIAAPGDGVAVDVLVITAVSTEQVKALRDEAEAYAEQAALYDGPRFDTVDDLLADTTLTPDEISDGDIVQVHVGSFAYEVDAAGPVVTAAALHLRPAKAESINVLSLGADWQGSTDNTDIFSLAATMAKKVFIPDGNYVLSGAVMQNGVEWIGESTSGTILRVGENDRGAMEMPSGATLFDAKMKNMMIRAEEGVTGARGILQPDLSRYFAYAVLDGLEFSRNLRRSMEVNPIFLSARNVRDGYIGAQVVGQYHQFMQAKWSGSGVNSPNFNHFESCQFFRSDDPDGVFDLDYGWSFGFDHCDFEQCPTRVMRALSIRQVVMRQCWFEACGSVASPEYFRLADSALPGAVGASLWVEDATVDFGSSSPITRFVNATGASRWGVDRASFRNVPTGARLGRTDAGNAGLPLLGAKGLVAMTGAGAAGFMTDMRERIDNAELTGDVVPAPGMAAVPAFVVSPVSAAVMTAATSGAVPPAPADVTSLVGLGSSLRITTSDSVTIAAVALPAKMVQALRGKEVTLAIGAHWLSSGAAERIAPAVWEDVSAGPSTAPTYTATGISRATTAYGVVYVTFTVGASASSLSIGTRTGGSASGAQYQLERLALFRGKSVPDVL